MEPSGAKVLGCRGGGRVGQEPVNLAGDGAFEATEGFLGAFAFAGSFLDVGPGAWFAVQFDRYIQGPPPRCIDRLPWEIGTVLDWIRHSRTSR